MSGSTEEQASLASVYINILSIRERLLEETGLSPTMRPIDLDMSDWSRLCNSYMRIIRENPSLAKFQARVGEPDLAKMFDYKSDSGIKRHAISDGG